MTTPPKEAIDAACAMTNKANRGQATRWDANNHGDHPSITTLATVIAERDALSAKYEPKPDPLLAEADELLAKYLTDGGKSEALVAEARSGTRRAWHVYRVILFNLRQRDKDI